MKSKKIPIFLFFSFLLSAGFSQTNLKLGGGYFGESITRPGLVLELEREVYASESLSLPIRAHLGYALHPEYHTLFLEVHKGFRQHFPSGLFVEQSIGVGVLSTFYMISSIFYQDKYGNRMRPYKGANFGFMPSVELGVGYTFPDGKNSIWVRPKVLWNLGFRSLAYPYGALQIGFSHTIKTKSS